MSFDRLHRHSQLASDGGRPVACAELLEDSHFPLAQGRDRKPCRAMPRLMGEATDQAAPWVTRALTNRARRAMPRPRLSRSAVERIVCACTKPSAPARKARWTRLWIPVVADDHGARRFVQPRKILTSPSPSPSGNGRSITITSGFRSAQSRPRERRTVRFRAHAMALEVSHRRNVPLRVRGFPSTTSTRTFRGALIKLLPRFSFSVAKHSRRARLRQAKKCLSDLPHFDLRSFASSPLHRL